MTASVRLGGLLFLSVGLLALPVPAAPPDDGFRFPTVNPAHPHARMLLANALRIADPAHELTDPASGYPFEGWNHDPASGVLMRSFTQLTAIGLWMEMLANVAAGHADTPFLARADALNQLARLVGALRRDQRDRRVGAKGLLVNFPDFGPTGRRSSLAGEVDRLQFTDVLGRETGNAAWSALAEKGWIAPRPAGRTAAILRGAEPGWGPFTGPLAPFRAEPTRSHIEGVLNHRPLMAVFGDNANLSASAARAVGALLGPELKESPQAAEVRAELERFLDAQRDGYANLYNPETGLFYFGWDATHDRLLGWPGPDGDWRPGHSDYLVNEFRGPTTFVILRHGLPVEALANLGFKMKPYRLAGGRELYGLAPWEGSAFQAVGLGVTLGEEASPKWRELLANAVDIQIDYSTRHGLPGFLSESYTGLGNQYTGEVGVPGIAVSKGPRITDAPSLYTLGPAYTVAPEKVEQFLAANWGGITPLLTDHGPWEGFNVTQGKPIRFQTTAHTLSLALGLLGTGSEQMARYLDSRNLGGELAAIYRPSAPTDLLPTGEVAVRRRAPAGAGRVVSAQTGEAALPDVCVAVVSAGPGGVGLSGGTLTIGYRSVGETCPAVVALKPVGVGSVARIAIEIDVEFLPTGGRERLIRIPLPATPGLARIEQIAVTMAATTATDPVPLRLTRLRFEPPPAEAAGATAATSSVP